MLLLLFLVLVSDGIPVIANKKLVLKIFNLNIIFLIKEQAFNCQVLHDYISLATPLERSKGKLDTDPFWFDLLDKNNLCLHDLWVCIKQNDRILGWNITWA